jgi:hypothetical protein
MSSDAWGRTQKSILIVDDRNEQFMLRKIGKDAFGLYFLNTGNLLRNREHLLVGKPKAEREGLYSRKLLGFESLYKPVPDHRRLEIERIIQYHFKHCCNVYRLIYKAPTLRPSNAATGYEHRSRTPCVH